MALRQVQEPASKATTLHVKVVDEAKEGRPVVNVKLPISLVKAGMKIGQAFSPQLKEANVDWDAVMAVIEQGGDLGKIVEVEDQAERKTVEVWVE